MENMNARMNACGGKEGQLPLSVFSNFLFLLQLWKKKNFLLKLFKMIRYWEKNELRIFRHRGSSPSTPEPSMEETYSYVSFFTFIQERKNTLNGWLRERGDESVNAETNIKLFQFFNLKNKIQSKDCNFFK